MKPVKEKGYSNYSLAIGGGLLAGLGLSLTLLLTLVSKGQLPSWLIDLLFGSLFVSQIISGTGYSFTGFDILFKEKTVFQLPSIIKRVKENIKNLFNKERKGEFIGLVTGFLLSVALSVTQIVKHALPSVVSFLPGIGKVAFFIMTVSSISGLCSRLGRTADVVRKKEPEFLRRQNINYVLSVIAGAVLGVVFASVILGVVGITSVMTFGGALPAWFGASVFAVGTVSTFASASGYFGRVADFFLGDRALGMSELRQAPTLKMRATAERVGTTIGSGLGVAFGLILILTGLATLPLFGLGLPKLLAGILVMGVSVSGMGGAGNRIGHFIGKIRARKSVQHVLGPAHENIKAHGPDLEPACGPSNDYLPKPVLAPAPIVEPECIVSVQRSRKPRKIVVQQEPISVLLAKKGMWHVPKLKNDLDSGRRDLNPRYAAACA